MIFGHYYWALWSVLTAKLDPTISKNIKINYFYNFGLVFYILDFLDNFVIIIFKKYFR